MDLLPKLKKLLQVNPLICPTDRIILAVSGGVDSIVLLDLLSRLSKTLPLEIWVAHLNHNLRGSESKMDAEFVAQEALRRGLPYRLKTLPRGLLKKKGNLQETARQFRYQFFLELAQELSAHKVATAHQAEDQLETFLLRLVRGTGIGGLRGIFLERPFGAPHEAQLIRPLLFFSKERILKYAKARGLSWREDSSNLQECYLRNKIRHRIVTEIKQIDPHVTERVSQALDNFREEEEWIEDWLSQASQHAIFSTPISIKISLDWLGGQARAIRYRLYKKSLRDLPGVQRRHFDAIEQIVLARNRKARVSLPQGWGAYVSESELIFQQWRDAKASKQRGFFD